LACAELRGSVAPISAQVDEEVRIIRLLDISGRMRGHDDLANWDLAREAVYDVLVQASNVVPIAVPTVIIHSDTGRQAKQAIVREHRVAL